MRSQTRSLIVKLIDRLEHGNLKPVDAALELRRILNDDLADTIERKARF
jgi:hypothetical protein